MSEKISNDSYSINETTLPARGNDIKTITQPVKYTTNLVQNIYTIKTNWDKSRTGSNEHNNTRIACITLKHSKLAKRTNVKLMSP